MWVTANTTQLTNTVQLSNSTTLCFRETTLFRFPHITYRTVLLKTPTLRTHEKSQHCQNTNQSNYRMWSLSVRQPSKVFLICIYHQWCRIFSAFSMTSLNIWSRVLFVISNIYFKFFSITSLVKTEAWIIRFRLAAILL